MFPALHLRNIGSVIARRFTFLCLLALLFFTQAVQRANGAGEPEASVDRRGVKLGILPIANFSTDRGMEVGALAQRFDYGESGAPPFKNLTTLQLSYATEGPRQGFLAYEQTASESSRLRWGLTGQYLENPFQPYFGLGDATLLDPERHAAGDYQYDYTEGSLDGFIRSTTSWGPELVLGVSLTRSNARSTRDTSQFASDFGSKETSLLYPKATLRAIWELRDSEFIPSKGTLLSAALTTSPGLGAANRFWYRVDTDYRRYFPLVERRWLVLATQARYGFSSRDAPLNEKVRIGSFGTVRGLPLNRYLSNHSFMMRGELRAVVLRSRLWERPLKGGLGVFSDVGWISDRLADLPQADLHPAFGISLFGSYFTDDFLGVFDIGFAEGNRIVYLRLGHAF